ncbi:MAG: right-handed parallel beta-helix repeat-containing protein [Cyanobacteria bacterium P01_D01_bin.1]
MAYQYSLNYRYQAVALCSLLGGLLGSLSLSTASVAQVAEDISPPLQISVTSPMDGPVRADAVLTLREAIEILNGTLPLTALSAEEQRLAVPSAGDSVIQFDLPEGERAIALQSILPAIARPNTTIDGTTQPGYDPTRFAAREIEIPTPVVTIRPAADTEIFRGLTLSADNITVRGLNLYGFNAASQVAQSTPPADIFITHRPAPLNRETPLPAVGYDTAENGPPKGIVIEQNWLGLTLEETLPTAASGFGVSVFDSVGTTVRENHIAYHNGSAVITGRQADNLQVINNILVNNGLAGMPDAIRMDGSVENSLISSNLICGNDGSGIFLFKPEGSVKISDNDIRYNGQRLRRAAVYLMGDNHQVIDNSITNQKGSGVVVTAFGFGPRTQSQGNVITGNEFSSLEGLSVDLNVRRSRRPQNFQTGDGPNPIRNSRNRREDTGNSAVNAPQFASPEFFIINDTAVLRGRVDSNNQVELYQATGEPDTYGQLGAPVQTVTADEEGNFEFVLTDVSGGEGFSAIATDPRYGSSEPALNTVIRSLDESQIVPADSAESPPQCTTPPAPQPIPPEPEPTPEVIRLEVPRNIHFGLDQDFVSVESAAVLDQIAAVLTQYPHIVVDLHGHTDSRASVAYNEDLARRRAENTRRYLLGKGIGAERMTIRSLGETELLVAETDRINYARNRRVEFVFQDVRGVNIEFFTQEEDLQIEP